MANDLNRCDFIGRLGKDPDVRYSTSGDAIASFSLAIGSQWKDKSGNKQESTEWVNCVAFGKIGEIIGQFLYKGSQVYISGRLKTEKYQDKSGADRYSTKIVVNNMQMLGNRQESNPDQESKQQQKQAGGSGFEDMDDDLPPF